METHVEMSGQTKRRVSRHCYSLFATPFLQLIVREIRMAFHLIDRWKYGYPCITKQLVECLDAEIRHSDGSNSRSVRAQERLHG